MLCIIQTQVQKKVTHFLKRWGYHEDMCLSYLSGNILFLHVVIGAAQWSTNSLPACTMQVLSEQIIQNKYTNTIQI